MLFEPLPIDFDRQVIVFVHIPKTAGTSLVKVLAQHFGPERCVETRMEKIDKVYAGQSSRLLSCLGRTIRNNLTLMTGTDPLLPKNIQPSALNRIAVLSGHFTLGEEPRMARMPLYITLVRDPVERFISHYYFLHDLREQVAAPSRDRQPARKYDLEHYVDLLRARRLRGVTNVHCRYIGGVESFEYARQAIAEQVFLAAPSERLDDFLRLLGEVSRFGPTVSPRENVGQAHRRAPRPSERTLKEIRSLVAEDQKLFDYVSRSFDETYRRFAPAERSARASALQPPEIRNDADAVRQAALSDHRGSVSRNASSNEAASISPKRWRRWGRLVIEARTASTAVFDRRVPWRARAISIALILAYNALPCDPVPNCIPVVGHLDDVVAVGLAAALCLWLIPRRIMRQHRAAAMEWLARRSPGAVAREPR